jgi:hypothetical protein
VSREFLIEQHPSFPNSKVPGTTFPATVDCAQHIIAGYVHDFFFDIWGTSLRSSRLT